MDPIHDFEYACGTIVGTEHLRLKKNNQDAYALSVGTIRGQPALAAVVCDGCGSQPSSEVGAKLSAPLLTSAMLHYAHITNLDIYRTLYLAEQDLLSHLTQVTRKTEATYPGRSKNISEWLLFTVVGFLMTPEKTWIFSLGDGVYCVNDEMVVKEYEGNAPPYLGYRLISPEYKDLHLDVDICFETEVIDSILIGTDGVAQLADLHEAMLPGKDKPVGPLSQFWEEDRYFKNKDMIRRKLLLMNRETVVPDWDNKTLKRCLGLLEDDTTMIVARRKVSDDSAI